MSDKTKQIFETLNEERNEDTDIVNILLKELPVIYYQEENVYPSGKTTIVISLVQSDMTS